MLRLVNRRVFDHASLNVLKAAYAPSGRAIVGAGRLADSARGFLTTWDLATGTRGPVLDATERKIMAMAASPADSSIATSDSPCHCVDLWDSRPPRHLRRVRIVPEAGRRSVSGQLLEQTDVCSLAFSPDGRRLALGCRDTTAKVIDLANDAIVEFPHPDRHHVEFVAFAPEGRHLVAGSASRVVVWDLESGRREDEVRTPRENWQHVALDDAGRLVSVSYMGSIRIRDTPGGESERHAIEYRPTGAKFAYAPAQGLLAIGQADGRVILWDSAARARVGSLKVGDGLFHSLAFAPDGPRLCATMSGTESVVEVEWKR